jgi:hypothetical protein
VTQIRDLLKCTPQTQSRGLILIFYIGHRNRNLKFLGLYQYIPHHSMLLLYSPKNFKKKLCRLCVIRLKKFKQRTKLIQITNL